MCIHSFRTAYFNHNIWVDLSSLPHYKFLDGKTIFIKVHNQYLALCPAHITTSYKSIETNLLSQNIAKNNFMCYFKISSSIPKFLETVHIKLKIFYNLYTSPIKVPKFVFDILLKIRLLESTCIFQLKAIGSRVLTIEICHFLYMLA